ncbi:MAG: hypothetical protein ACOX2R_06705 [Anaerolineae bacterium]|jgi:hypothetical protein
MRRNPLRYGLLMMGAVLFVVTSGCAFSGLFRRVQPTGQERAVATAAVSTLAPTLTRVPAKAATPRVTEEPGTFTIEYTEEDILEMLADQSLSRDGVTVTVEEVSLGEGQVRAKLQVSESEMGLDIGVTVVGEPYLEDGQVYVQIISFSLDESVSGFVRMLAQAAIQEVIDQATGEKGIPMPVEGVEVLSVEVQPGLIIVSGRRP